MDKIKRCLKVKRGEEYKIRLGCVYEKEGLFFAAYKHGAEILKETLLVSDEIRKGSTGDYYGSVRTEDDNTYEFSNNIIAFCGERGEGKSSSMRTFAHALERIDVDRQNYTAEVLEQFWGMPISHYSFEVLPVIDPTMMRTQDSFMRVILSRMFAQVKKRWESFSEYSKNYENLRFRHDMPGYGQIEKILEVFRECYAYLDTLSKKPDIDNRYDDLEEIASLGDSGSLKLKFRELVKDYLDIMNQGHPMNESNSYLVLQIDDADLNIGQAYGILEDIRSFCTVPEVVILMAMNMKQLQQIIEQHYIRDFDLLLKYGEKKNLEDAPLSLRHCRHMAMMYIDKVIPGSRQIHLPQIDAVLKDETIDLSVSYTIPQNDGGRDSVADAFGKMDEAITDYQERLLGWLYQKIGIALIRPITYRHNILPGHLRELTHFLAFFGKMENLNTEYNIIKIHALLRKTQSELNGIWKEKRKEALETKERWIGNLQGLEQYFLKNWTGLHLSREGQRMMQEVEAAADTRKAQMICAFSDSIAERLHVYESVLPDTIYAKYSYAYVMNKLTSLSPEIRKEEDYNIVYALRFYYMLHIFKKLVAVTGDDDGYEQLLQEVKYESWIPDYSKMQKEYSYGRFEVNLYALNVFRPEFRIGDAGDLPGLLNRLNQMLYIILPAGEARGIEKEDILKYMSKPASDAESNIHVMFDWSFYFMSLVLGKSGTYVIPSTDEELKAWEMRVNVLNMSLQFLFSWDVQHYLAKNLKQDGTSDYDNTSNLKSWIASYWEKLIEQISTQKYIKWAEQLSALTFDNTVFPINAILPNGFETLYYGNKEYLKHLLNLFTYNLNHLIAQNGEMKEEQTAHISFILGIVTILNRCPVDFRNCSIFGEEAKLSEQIINQCNQILKDYKAEQIMPIFNDCKKFCAILKKSTNNKIDRVFEKNAAITKYGK